MPSRQRGWTSRSESESASLDPAPAPRSKTKEPAVGFSSSWYKASSPLRPRASQLFIFPPERTTSPRISPPASLSVSDPESPDSARFCTRAGRPKSSSSPDRVSSGASRFQVRKASGQAFESLPNGSRGRRRESIDDVLGVQVVGVDDDAEDFVGRAGLEGGQEPLDNLRVAGEILSRQLREPRDRVPELPFLFQSVVHDGAARSCGAKTRKGRHDPVEQEPSLATIVGAIAGLEQHLLQVIKEGQERAFGPLVLHLAQGRHGLLHERRRKTQDRVAPRRVQFLLGWPIGPGGRDSPQEVEKVAPVVPLLVPLRLAEDGLEPIDSFLARRGAVHLEQLENQLAALPLHLPQQLIEKPLGARRREETEKAPQERMVALRVGEPAQALQVQRLIPFGPDGLDRSGVHAVLSDDALGEIEHPDGLRKGSLVEALDSGLDHFAEAHREVSWIFRLSDDAVHRFDRATLRRRWDGRIGRRLPGAFRRGCGRRFRRNPAGQAVGERAKDRLGLRLQADLAQPLEVPFELLRIVGAADRGGQYGGEKVGAPSGFRDARVRDLPAEPFEKQREMT